jgi:hypothetical protein
LASPPAVPRGRHRLFRRCLNNTRRVILGTRRLRLREF